MKNKDNMVDKKIFGSVLVVGGGISGIQAALDLANSGYYVYMTEEKSAIGGVMAQLDKTFPTNDCSMCVISPKLVECGRHLNIELMTLTEVESVNGNAGNFEVKLKQKPRYVDLDKCTACGECAKACPVSTPNLFDEKLRDRKAIFKLYPQGMPSAYSIDKVSTSPCKVTCPAHVSIQGYIALIRERRYEEAIALFKKEHPFPGVCGRVCHHPCEGKCTRNDIDESLGIRELHRFLADYEIDNNTNYIPKINVDLRSEKIAIIGSGPAGLTAAENLIRKGFMVTVFEKMPQTGGMMRYGIPEYRLPRNIIDYEVDVIRKMGANICCNVEFGKDITLDSLKSDGYKACFIAIGLHSGRALGIDGEDAEGVFQGIDFLRDVSLGYNVNVGNKVLVIGGGNVAIDVALTAKRIGAKEVILICLEKREEMPAWDYEIEEAIDSNIEIINEFGPKSFKIDDTKSKLNLKFKMCTSVFDTNGRFNPQYNDSICKAFDVDNVIIAIGQTANLVGLEEQKIPITRMGTLEANSKTLQSSLGWVFVGGDAFYGPKSVVDAVACGKKAAESIFRFINGIDILEGRNKMWNYTKPDISEELSKPKIRSKYLEPLERECNFLEVFHGYNEDEALLESNRCLQCGVCSECYRCVDACLANAIDHKMIDRSKFINVGAIVVASGFTPFNPVKHKTFPYVNHPNIVTSLEFERILSASGPYSGHMVRPSDNKEPDKIAWIQCVGSRDINLTDHSYCSSVCCMYTNKQTVIAKEHSNKPLDTAVFFMDMRTCGKDFDRYYDRAKNEKGVRFVRSRVHTIDPIGKDNLMLRYVSEDGKFIEEVFDMVVLAVGLSPNHGVSDFAKKLGIDLNEHSYAFTKNLTPVSSTRDGIYVCGAFKEPKDIPESVMEASAAASSATNLLSSARNTLVKIKELPPELNVSEDTPRVGVFVCNCGINIGGIANILSIKDYVSTLPYVVHVEDNLFTCSQDTQDKMKEVIIENNINRVVVASCSPRTHEALFQETIRDAGLNKYLFEMANIRDQNTWVHMDDPLKATEKAKDLIRMAVAKSIYVEPLHQVKLDVIQGILIVGAGVAGMEAALSVANQGIRVYLVERSGILGGIANKLRTTWGGEPIKPYLDTLIKEVKNNSKINLFINTEVILTTGIIGNFSTTLLTSDNDSIETKIQHGATILATGGKEYIPNNNEYCYKINPNVLTHSELDKAILSKDKRIFFDGSVVFIQCVGSRDLNRPYCSRICCTSTLKNSITLKKLNPNLNIYVIYRDIRSYGFREELYKKARELGVVFLRYDLENNKPIVESDGSKLKIRLLDHVLQRNIEITSNILVLATGVVSNENQKLFEQFKVPINSDGFLVEAHAKLRPVDFSSEGIFMSGLAHYPKLLDESITQARASASRAMTILSKDSIMVGGVVAEVTSDKCAVCLTCVRTCPYNVPFISSDGSAEIVAAECHGCGICVSECPGKAIQLKHFTDEQIIAKTDALFAD